MAFTHTLHFDGSTGSKKLGSAQEYEAIYRVISDDADDQAEKVLEYFRDNVVDIGTVYEYANDEDLSTIAKDIKVKREKNSTGVWIVTVKFQRAKLGAFVEEFITEDLPLRCQDVSMTTIQHQKPVEESTYWSGMVKSAAAKMPPGTKTIPVNSAFVPFNPGLEKDVAGLAVRIVRRLAQVNGTSVKQVMNNVNSEPFTIAHCGFSLHVEKYQARVVSGALALRNEDNQLYWELPLSMEIISEGWRDFIVDRGVQAAGDPGSDDGRGGTYTQNDMIAGVPMLRELADGDETPISDPVLLDGNGQPLDLSAGIPFIALEYQKYKEVDFRTIAYFQGFVF